MAIRSHKNTGLGAAAEWLASRDGLPAGMAIRSDENSGMGGLGGIDCIAKHGMAKHSIAKHGLTQLSV